MKFGIIRGGMLRRIGLFDGITPEVMVRPISDLSVREAIAGALDRRDRIVSQRVEATHQVMDLEEGLKRHSKIEARLQGYEDQALELAKWDLEQEAKEQNRSSKKEAV